MPRAPIRIASVLLVVALAGCGDGDERTDDVPEHATTYPVSVIVKDRRQGRSYGETLRQAQAIQRKLDGGASFEELARADSEDEPTRVNDGFYGFADFHPESRFAGAVQAIAPGHNAIGPIETEKGLLLIRRHDYEEGRRKEAATRVVVLGFLVASREALNGPDRSPEEARKLAEEALRRIRTGEITLADAAKTYGNSPPRRKDALLQVAARGSDSDWLYRAVASLPEGALVPQPAVGPDAFAVVARGKFFRSVVRHIVVAHALSEPKQAFKASRSRDEARAMAEKALSEAKPDLASWEVLLTRYNDDPASGAQQGTLGSVTAGMLIPELESVVLETPPGKIATRLAETPAGFHVIWRVD